MKIIILQKGWIECDLGNGTHEGDATRIARQLYQCLPEASIYLVKENKTQFVSPVALPCHRGEDDKKREREGAVRSL